MKAPGFAKKIARSREHQLRTIIEHALDKNEKKKALGAAFVTY